MDIVIEPMKPESEAEIEGKGYVHWKSWQEAYAGLIDLQYLKETVTLEKCVETARRYPDNILLAKDGERVVGFAAYGPYRDDSLPETGELYAIYILKEYYGTGVGPMLLGTVLGKLSRYDKVALWVLKGNERAIHFYQEYGFEFDGAEQTIKLGTDKTELRMVFVED